MKELSVFIDESGDFGEEIHFAFEIPKCIKMFRVIMIMLFYQAPL